METGGVPCPDPEAVSASAFAPVPAGAESLRGPKKPCGGGKTGPTAGGTVPAEAEFPVSATDGSDPVAGAAGPEAGGIILEPAPGLAYVLRVPPVACAPP